MGRPTVVLTRATWILQLGLLTWAAQPPAAADRSTITRVIDQLEAVHSFSEVTISPDGRWVTWTEPAPAGGDGTVILVANRTEPNAKPVRVTALSDPNVFVAEEGVAWSPDSRRLAFLSYASNPQQQQIYLAKVSAPAQATKLTSLDGYVTDLRWTPDGKNVGFLYASGGGGGGPLEAAKAETGVIGSAIHNQQLNVVSATGDAPRAISPAELNIYEYDWSPDGYRYVAIAAPGPADNNWWTAKMYIGSTQAGTMSPVYVPPVNRQIAIPRWAPDGKQIAFVGGDLFTIPAAEGITNEPKNLTPDRRTSVTSLQWQRPDRLLITEDINGGGSIGTMTVSSGEIETLWRGDELLHLAGNFPNLSIAADGKISASIRDTWAAPPEVWSGPFGDWKPFTHENAGQKPQWSKAETINWISGNQHVQGWLLYPLGFEPSKRYPMVVSIHGGPASMRASTWPSVHFDMSVMSSLGYFVFFPNPRGSYGEGEAFTKANVKDFGHGDLEDILAGLDAVFRKAPVDPNRLGVTGWSYGGFMTMWTVTQTNRFRAAVAGAGISNWKSYYGENLIDQWMIPYFGASVYDNPQVYAKSSPIEFVKQVKTPTLIVVGERDAECPAPQSYEFWHALRAIGVPTQLIVYPGEGHSLRSFEHRKDVLRRTAEWFDQYLR
ncbi:MAG: prolyl oligopeptidase family serine peptidase [Bryobacteraceae bacterium]